MYQCPLCGQNLTKNQTDYGFFWSCESCGNWLISFSVLRRTIETSFLNHLWQKAQTAGEGKGAACPMCRKPMNIILMEALETPLPFILCKNCGIGWLSPKARAAMPVQPPPAEKTEEKENSKLPPEAAKIAALHEVELIGERARSENQFDASHLPLWQKVLAIIGVPVLDREDELSRFPWGTVLVTLATLGTSAYFFTIFRSADYYGFIPREFDRDSGMTFISSFLIHGGWAHLLSNMYFLMLFGRIVENKTGTFLFLALLLFSTIGGNALTLCFDPQSDIPNVGASGGIAGVLLFYGFTFPRKKLVFFFTTYGLMLPRLIRIPSWAALMLWVLLQVFGASFQKAGMSEVSYSSHLGGLLVGLVFWLISRFWVKKDVTGKVRDAVE